MQPIRTHLNLLVDKDTIYKMLAVGSEFDVNKNGLFDARSGCVNVWCSPDDKPDCWDIPITKGGLHYPREYVGGIHWEWDEKTDKFSIFIEAVPYNLERHYKQLQSCLDWVEIQAKNLLRLAHIQETVLGICCPFCDYVLPNDELLNTLIDHISLNHTRVLELNFGHPSVIKTANGFFPLKTKTDIKSC